MAAVTPQRRPSQNYQICLQQFQVSSGVVFQLRRLLRFGSRCCVLRLRCATKAILRIDAHKRTANATLEMEGHRNSVADNTILSISKVPSTISTYRRRLTALRAAARRLALPLRGLYPPITHTKDEGDPKQTMW